MNEEQPIEEAVVESQQDDVSTDESVEPAPEENAAVNEPVVEEPPCECQPPVEEEDDSSYVPPHSGKFYATHSM